MRERNRPPIELVTDRNGVRVYHIDRSPEDLPPVRTGDLAESWDAARQAATASLWGEPRMFRFRPAACDPVDLALTDADAACWAEAVDARWGVRSVYGLSLCLRLLGLVSLLSNSPRLRTLCPMTRGGASLDPALLRAAAAAPLSPRGHLDERRVLAHLDRPVASPLSILHSGASS